jgi:hypothetical protein
MLEPTEPSDPTKPTEATAAGQAASAGRVIAEAARGGRVRPGRWVPATPPRAALAEAAGLPACRPAWRLPIAQPAGQPQHAARRTADDHHQQREQ